MYPLKSNANSFNPAANLYGNPMPIKQWFLLCPFGHWSLWSTLVCCRAVGGSCLSLCLGLATTNPPWNNLVIFLPFRANNHGISWGRKHVRICQQAVCPKKYWWIPRSRKDHGLGWFEENLRTSCPYWSLRGIPLESNKLSMIKTICVEAALSFPARSCLPPPLKDKASLQLGLTPANHWLWKIEDMQVHDFRQWWCSYMVLWKKCTEIPKSSKIDRRSSIPTKPSGIACVASSFNPAADFMFISCLFNLDHHGLEWFSN